MKSNTIFGIVSTFERDKYISCLSKLPSNTFVIDITHYTNSNTPFRLKKAYNILYNIWFLHSINFDSMEVLFFIS